MNWEAFITCAVTGAGATTDRSDQVPVTPEQIADRCDRGGAGPARRSSTSTSAIPPPAAASRDTGLYREVVERIRSADVDVVINLTAGMGGDLVLGGADAPLPLEPTAPTWRAPRSGSRTSTELLPEICTLDCGSMNFAAGGDYVMVNTPAVLREMAATSRRSASGRSSRCSTPATWCWSRS